MAAGTYAAIAILYGASVALSLVSLVVPGRTLALLGLVPLFLGLRELFQPGEEAQVVPKGRGILAVAGINIAAGGDNVGVYAPLFATSPAQAIAVYGAVFAVLTGAMLWAAQRLVTHPALGAPVRRYGPRLVPWVLIALGIWILAGF